MASYTPLLFHRRPPYNNTPGGRVIEDDLMSLCSMAEVTLPRISREVRRREKSEVRKVSGIP
ncbi:unnamed protein product [Timema podura]|uniref:Uncharacterized protein n=1 Tax=Timema podura TaxID=61482 RepID=A0ABN7P079_TIMPD|nr:unnamed protein product [Timema podura]